MTDNTAPAVPAPGLLARAIGVIFSPAATFRSIIASPTWAGILFLTALVIGLAQGLPQFTEKGRQAAIAMNVQSMERFTGQPVTAQQREGIERQARLGPYFAIIGVFIAMPIFALLFAAIYWAIFNALLGGTATFKQMLAIVCHANVIQALGTLAAAPIQWVTGTITMGGPFNLGVLAPMIEDASLIKRTLDGLSLFGIWGVVVTAIGLGVLFKRSAVNISIALILLYVLIVLGMAALFGSFMGR